MCFWSLKIVTKNIIVSHHQCLGAEKLQLMPRGQDCKQKSGLN